MCSVRQIGKCVGISVTQWHACTYLVDSVIIDVKHACERRKSGAGRLLWLNVSNSRRWVSRRVQLTWTFDEDHVTRTSLQTIVRNHDLLLFEIT